TIAPPKSESSRTTASAAIATTVQGSRRRRYQVACHGPSERTETPTLAASSIETPAPPAASIRVSSIPAAFRRLGSQEPACLCRKSAHVASPDKVGPCPPVAPHNGCHPVLQRWRLRRGSSGVGARV